MRAAGRPGRSSAGRRASREKTLRRVIREELRRRGAA